MLSPAHVQTYELDPALPPQFRRSAAFDARHVYRLTNVCASPRTGLVWLPRGPILAESCGALSRLLGWESFVLEEPLLRPGRRVEGPVVLLAPGNYYHWLLEYLPVALHALAVEPAATLVVPTTQPRFVEEVLALLAPSNVLRIDESFLADRLVLAAREPRSGWLPDEDVEILRATFLPRVAASAGREDIYVSRRLTSRRPADEAELERLCASAGVSPVTSETLPFLDQVALFSKARTIVSTHGAGLANLVFAEPGGRLLELFLPELFNDCYARLAVSRGLGYLPFYCSGKDNAASTVPLEEIAAALDVPSAHA